MRKLQSNEFDISFGHQLKTNSVSTYEVYVIIKSQQGFTMTDHGSSHGGGVGHSPWIFFTWMGSLDPGSKRAGSWRQTEGTLLKQSGTLEEREKQGYYHGLETNLVSG